uniref:Uncharacterized protein n=1 Tax=Anguilla anguilla TaxID=7936 RepID=A0A0E9XMY7_ANGAN
MCGSKNFNLTFHCDIMSNHVQVCVSRCINPIAYMHECFQCKAILIIPNQCIK